MYFQFPSSNMIPSVVSRNIVHSLSAVSESSGIIGIPHVAGTVTYHNNMVRLGLDETGAAITSNQSIIGIEMTNTASGGLYNNTVYIGGAGVGVGTQNTFAFSRTSTSPTRDLRNNIFVNARSNGEGTGKHYAIRSIGITFNPISLISNHNNYYANGAGGVLGRFQGGEATDLATLQTQTGDDANSVSVLPAFINATGNATNLDLRIDPTVPSNLESGGAIISVVTKDFDDEVRQGNPGYTGTGTSYDIGADEFEGSRPCVPVTPTFTQVSPICAGAFLAALSTTSNNDIAGTWSPELNNMATTTYTFTPNSGQCGTTTTMTIVVNPLPNAPIASAQSFCGSGTVDQLVASLASENSVNVSVPAPATPTLRWYNQAIGGLPLASTTALATGTYYVAAFATCESSRTPVSVTVNPFPNAPIAQSQVVASTATVANLVANGQDLKWYDDGEAPEPLASTTSITAGTYYVSQTVNNCESTKTAVQVTVGNGCTSPTLTSVTAAPACVGSSTNIVLSGLIPNSFGTAHYKLNNGIVQTISGTSTAQGTFSFSSGTLPATANGLVIEVTKITTPGGCETSFTGKTVTLVVSPKPTLSTVTAAPACEGSSTTIVLSGLIPNASGTVFYRENNGPVQSLSGTSSAQGTFSFVTPALPLAANGIVITITKIATTSGCETVFTGKTVALVVYPKPTLSTITAAPVAAGNSTTIVLSGMQANTFGTASYTENNGPVQTVSGTTTPQGTFSFTTPVLPLAANGVVIRVLKIVNVNGCETTFKDKSVTLVVTNPNAINRPEAVSTEEATFVLYPNPVNDVLNIEASLGIQSVEILNNIGQQVLTSTQKHINVSHLPSGVYLVRIQDAANNLETKKIIIK
jgi:hypothetical protein